MPQLKTINEKAYSAAIRLIGGDGLLNAIIMTAEVLAQAEAYGFEEGYSQALAYNGNTDDAEADGYKDGYLDGVEDARHDPKTADALLKAWDDIAELHDRELADAVAALEQDAEPRTPKSDDVNTFENYGLTATELAGRIDSVEDHAADQAAAQEPRETPF